VTNDNETYPWEEEYLAWCRDQPKVSVYDRMKTREEWDRILLKAKASDILAVALEIIDTPEIYDRYVAFIERTRDPKATFKNIHGDPCPDYEDRELDRAGLLAQNYYRWWRMKRDINDNIDTYGSVPSLVYLIAEGKISKTDINEMRKHLFKYHEHQIIEDSVQFGKKK
jgi:hypothetical protein